MPNCYERKKQGVLKTVALFFAVALLILTDVTPSFAGSYPNHLTNPYPTAVGIDVSMWNGKNGRKIDWKAVREAGFSFVIIKISKRDPDTKIAELVDEKFEEYYAGAGAAGLKRGVYVFSYATDEFDAQIEAEACLDALKKRPLELPVAFDIESNDNIKKLIKKGKIAAADAVNAFCDTIEAGGYQSMVYTGGNFITKYIDYDLISDRRLWLARYPAMPTDAVYQDYMNFNASHYPYYMWQFNSKAYVPTASYTSTSKGKTIHHCDVNFIYDPAFADSGIETLRYNTLQNKDDLLDEYDTDTISPPFVPDPQTQTNENLLPTALFFNESYMNLDANNINTYKLNLSVFPTGASLKTVKFISSDNEIATVDDNGILTPKKSGSVVITASSGFVNATAVINITKDIITPSSITLSESELLMTEGETASLVATVFPENTLETVQYTSSDPSVVTVDGKGKLKAIEEGEAVILATVGSLSAECDIIVEAKENEEKPKEPKKKKEEKNNKKDTEKEETPEKKDKVSKSKLPLDIVRSSVKMSVGESYKFEVRLKNGIDPADITWQTSDGKIVSGYDSGLMTAKSKGKAILTAKLKSDPSIKDTVTVTVLESPKTVSLPKKSITLKKGGNYKLKPIFNKGAASINIKYKSSNPKVAKVSKNGNIKAIGKGTATITLTTHNNKTVTLKVTVK